MAWYGLDAEAYLLWTLAPASPPGIFFNNASRNSLIDSMSGGSELELAVGELDR